MTSRGDWPTPEALARFPLKGAPPADRQSRIRGGRLARPRIASARALLLALRLLRATPADRRSRIRGVLVPVPPVDE